VVKIFLSIIIFILFNMPNSDNCKNGFNFESNDVTEQALKILHFLLDFVDNRRE